MRVTVLYFAAARERAGCDRESIDLPEGTTAGQAKAHLLGLHPALAPIAPHLRLAVDKAFAPDAAVLSEGAEIALIPPVSGGLA